MKTLKLSAVAVIWIALVWSAGMAYEAGNFGCVPRWLQYKLIGYVEIEGLKLYLNPNDLTITKTIVAFGKWEPLLTHAIREELGLVM